MLRARPELVAGAVWARHDTNGAGKHERHNAQHADDDITQGIGPVCWLCCGVDRWQCFGSLCGWLRRDGGRGFTGRAQVTSLADVWHAEF